jgi:tuftelin-interacting protein 11
MGRRKDRIAKEHYSSDSGESEDDEAQYGEFESFTSPSRRKKRRHRRSKEDAMLGVFADGSSDDDRDLMRKNIRYKEVNFVEKEDNDERQLSEEEEQGKTSRAGLGSSQTVGLGFRVAQEESGQAVESEEVSEDDFRPRIGLGARMLGGGSKSRRGIGLGFQPTQQPSNEDEEQSYRPAFGFNQFPEPPLSTTFSQHTTTQSDTMHTALPAAPKPSPLLSKKGTSTASNRKYGLGASMMEKMGYKQGQGLGSEGQGMLNPIETKLRPERMGLGGVKEMTAQAKEEARRRGQIVSDDEDTKEKRRRRKIDGGSGTSTPRSRAAKKVVYQTAEEMAGGMTVPATIQKLVDLQGREVDLSSVVLSGKMEDELRIAQLARRDLKRFGDEWKALGEQKKYVDRERDQMRDELIVEENRIRKAEEWISEIENIVKSTIGQGREGLDAVSDDILNLQRKVTNEDIIAFGLDEVVVGMIQPMIKQALSDWDPLLDATSNGLTTTLKSWNTILRIRSKHQQDQEIEAESGLFHHQLKLYLLNSPKLIHRSSPYESLFYHTILPKIRSVINNAWTPYDPQPVISLLETWSPLLPGFIHNLLLEQVIMPKLRRAIDHWNPRRSRETVHLWIFPWLPYLGTHMDDLIKTVQHKFKVVLETWDIKKGIISGLEEWRDLFGKGVLEDLLLKHILPKLALELRENFEVDPSDQKLEVLLETIMPWQKYFRSSTWGQLLSSEFFSKWLGMLHLWLTSEQVNLEEVGQWYEWWKHQVFPSEILEMEEVRKGFKAGLDLMSKAADYVDQGIPLTKLPAPVLTGPQRPVTKPVRMPKKEVQKVVRQEIQETTFKDVLEDLCAENNLLLVPLRTADEATGKALFRITASADGKGGVTGYIGDGDVLWLQTKRQGPYEPVSLEKVVPLAERR